MRSDFIELPGLKVHALRGGAGMPLVLLHGWPEFSYVWRKNIPVLAERFEVVAPDLRGFGKSGKPGSTPRPQDYVDDLAHLADHLGLERFGIVSHDVGSWIAQAYARRAPGRLMGLVFFDCLYPGIGTRWLDPDHIGEIWYQSFHQLDWAADLVGASHESLRTYLRHFLSHWAYDPRTFDEDLEIWVDAFSAPGALAGGFAWYTAIAETRRAMMRGAALPTEKIAVPTRVLWGAEDPILKAAWADRLGDTFANVRVDLVPGAGHFVHYERPDLANREITAFFEGLADGS